MELKVLLLQLCPSLRVGRATPFSTGSGRSTCRAKLNQKPNELQSVTFDVRSKVFKIKSLADLILNISHNQTCSDEKFKPKATRRLEYSFEKEADHSAWNWSPGTTSLIHTGVDCKLKQINC